MKINSIIITTIILLSLSAIFCVPAQAVDPRAEVPGATITGVILDANGNSVPNATVRLFLDGQLFDVPRNPQQSGNGSYIPIGRYQFMRLPQGVYLITAEIPDAAGMVHGTNLSVTVNANTTTADLVIPDLVIAAPAVPSPSAAAAASPAPASFWVAGVALSLVGIYAHLVADNKSK